MLIKIQTRGFTLSQSLKEYVESKIRLMFERYRVKISRIDVMLLDVNGPKGGEDMRCSIRFKPNGFPPIVIQETAADMYDAINTCTHRMKRAANRHFNRIQHQRKIPPPPADDTEQTSK